MMIGKILKVEMPQLQKGASYGRALVFSFAIFGLAEITLAVMFAFGFVSGNEMLWFTIYIVALSFLAPLGLRMSGWKLVALLGVACLLWIGFASFQQVFDRCCVQKILMSYARGEDYRIKERQVSWFASSSAMAYVRFFISETDYLKRCAQEISSLRTEAEDIQKLHRIDFRNRVEIRRKALVENFLETGYGNKTTVAALNMFQGKYDRILKELQGGDCFNEQTSKDDLCRYLNSTCIGPYDFSDKGYSEIVATMLADARQNLTASGSEYSIGLSGGVDDTQEGRVVKIQVPKLPILDAFCLVAGHFNAVATYQIGCIWIRPNANAKRMPLSVREVEADESKMNQLNGSPVPVCSSPTNTNSGLFGGHDVLVAKGLVAIKTIKMPKMTFERKPLSDILSSVYKQCNLRLTEEWGFGVGLTVSGIDLNESCNLEIPALTIYDVFSFIAQRFGATARYADGRIYMGK